MEYIVDDKKLDAFTFIAFVKQVWQGNYDIEKTQCALSQTCLLYTSPSPRDA